MEHFYNIHGFIGVKIVSRSPSLIAGYDNYLRWFKTDLPPAQIHYEICDFVDFELPNHFKTGSSYIGFENGIYLPREKYAIVFDGQKIIEYTTFANRATNFLIQLLLLRMGKSFIHGLGVEVQGRGFIFPALGGVGKTILVSKLRKMKGFKFFGDDYIIIDKNSNMFSYPSDFSIYPYHIPIFPELKHTIFSNYLFKRKLFGLYYNSKKAINFIWRRISQRGVPLLNGWNADYVKVPVTQLVSDKNIGRQTKLTTAIFLDRYNDDKICAKKMLADELTQLIDGILWLESQHALPFLSALAAFGLIDLSNFATDQHDVLKNCLADLKRFRVSIPQKIGIESYIDYMIQFIQKTIK